MLIWRMSRSIYIKDCGDIFDIFKFNEKVIQQCNSFHQRGCMEKSFPLSCIEIKDHANNPSEIRDSLHRIQVSCL